MSRPMRMPDFAGTALVDILANGLAMLIIVIVLSIAARGEREQRTASQVEEVETMMSRRFSTSLVLNSLAASAPAQLHDYRNSPLDQQYDPETLPILELHRDFVREFYSGSLWRREALLRAPNVMDDWLTGFTEERKLRVRVDVYDIAQFYLAMSILRDHGITVQHWHFLAGGLGLAQAGQCPPGVAAQDCGGGMGGGAMGNSALPALTQGGGAGDSWPPADFPGAGGTDPEAKLSPFPGGAALGPLAGALSGMGGTGLIPGTLGLGAGGMLGSFPNARPGAGTGSQTSGLSGRPGQPGGEAMRFRLSSPESLFEDRGQALSWGDTKPSVVRILAALLEVTSRLQARLDAGVSPSPLLANFQALLRSAFTTPVTLDEDTRNMLSDLAWELSLNMAYDSSLSASGRRQEQPLRLIPHTLEEGAKTALMIAPNRQLQEVFLGQPAQATKPPPETARLILGLNTHPDVWRGLSLSLEWNAILLVPKQRVAPQLSSPVSSSQPFLSPPLLLQDSSQELRWRAVAYIAPEFDDFIIGFIYASIDEQGRLLVPAEDNRVRLDGRPLRTSYQAPNFGTRDWLVSLYMLLLICLLGFGFLVRYLLGRRPR